MIGRHLGHYEFLAKLGEGGMGVVYKARDAHLDRFVAIKVLPTDSLADPERRRRFTQEAKAASALNHPAIVTIHDIAHADGTDFIAMEYVSGKTLGELIGPKGLSLKDALAYGIQAASGLAKAHAAGIVHRDLKPSNIMVTDDGLVKILDFGVAKLTTSSDDDDEQLASAHTLTATDRLETAAGRIVGTAAYMSPEQAEGKKVDARSDIFSFGAVLYEMATGARAFQGSSPALTLAAVVNAEPAPPSQLAKDLPRDLERIIQRCLRKDPARRFQYMADLAVELEEIKTESGTAIAAVPGPARKSLRWSMVSALAVLLMGAGAWFLWARSSGPLPSATVVPLTSLSGDERFPTFSPDGSQVAFEWNSENGANTDIYVLPVGAATPVRLTTDPAEDTNPAWSPDGSRIAFVRRQENTGAVYLATPPVPNSEQKLADIRPVAGVGTNITTVSWFPDGRRLTVAERDVEGQMNGIVMIPIGRDEPRRLVWTTFSTGRYAFPSVSPDGQRVAYALCPSNFNCDVHVIELTSDFTSKDASRRLTAQNAMVTGIAWTPDGQSLIYGSLSGVARSYLWRVPLAGGQPERLELAGDRAFDPAVSGQSGKLAYARVGFDMDIWKLGSSGPPENFLSSTLDDRNAQFSPDGKRIAFESRRLGKDTQIWVANADGTNPAPLTEGVVGVGGSPRWSPDSRSLVFDGQEPDGRRAVYVVDAAGGRPRLLVTPGALPSWSRDGRVYFHDATRTGRFEVWRIPATGGGPIQITDNGGAFPLEAPDGKTVYYRKDFVTPGVVFARPTAGGPERRVLDSMAPGLHHYFPVENGIYYIAVPDPKLPFARELRFLDFATGKHETLSRFEARTGTGLSVSPDRKTILYSGTKPSAGDDLMLIRNFR